MAIEAHRRIVRLYYHGYMERPDGVRPMVMTAQQEFVLPKIGEYIEVERWQANDLINRYKDNGIYPLSLHPPSKMKQSAGDERRPYTQEEILRMNKERLLAALAAVEEQESVLNASVDDDSNAVEESIIDDLEDVK